MNDINRSTQNTEVLNEAFEMTKLRKRYKKYIKLMQSMLQQFKTDDNGVNVVKTFGMNSGFTNAVSSFFGFGKNAENRQSDVFIGVKPFAKNVCKLIGDNYKKSKTNFDSLVKNTNPTDSKSSAKAVSAASSILYEFFTEYMNSDKLLKQGGIDITNNSTMSADTYKKYATLINSYNPKNAGNNMQMFTKLSGAYDTMVQKFDVLGQRIIANFTKYFNKQMQAAGKDDEKIANALEGAQAKLSAAWKAQTDLIKSDFPAVIQTILASQEYSAYYEFIIKEVLPKTQEYISSSNPNKQTGNSQYINGRNNNATENDKIEGYGISENDLDAFVFDIPVNLNASDNAPYDEDSDVSEARGKTNPETNTDASVNHQDTSINSFIRVTVKNKSDDFYNLFNMTVNTICETFKSNGVTLKDGKINHPDSNMLSTAHRCETENDATNVIIDIAAQITKQTNAPDSSASQTAQDSSTSLVPESFTPDLIDNTTGIFESGDGISMCINCKTLINEASTNKVYALVSHCWGDGKYINPGESLMLGIKNIIKESVTMSDIAKTVKNSKTLLLCECNEQIKLNTYGKSETSFTKWNPMYTATAIITETAGAISDVKYLGSKKIVLY